MVKIAASRETAEVGVGQEAVTVLIEPRSLTRQCLSAWLEECEPDIALRAFNAPETAMIDETMQTSLIIWCIGSTSTSSSRFLEGLRCLTQRYPSKPLAILADREDSSEIREALNLGVNGYVPTSLDRSAVLEVLRFVRAGGTYVPASVLADANQPSAHGERPEREKRSLKTFERLTPRESDVVERLRQGKPNKVIAHELDISESTVKVFVHRILHKLGAVNRTEVAYLAQQWSDDSERRSESVF
jgi:DNA-binding NarL/FixJ family response regulator